MAYQKGGVLASGIVMYFFFSKLIAFKKIYKHLKLTQCCKLTILQLKMVKKICQMEKENIQNFYLLPFTMMSHNM